MASKESKGGSGFLWGLVLGIATGFALAVLFAPQSGEQTRNLGRERYAALRSQFRERYPEAWSQARESFQKARDQIVNQYTSPKNGTE